jgi:hypothetical protein
VTWHNVKKKKRTLNKKNSKEFDKINEYLIHLSQIVTGDGVEEEDIMLIFNQVGLDQGLAKVFVGLGSIMKDNFQEANQIFKY